MELFYRVLELGGHSGFFVVYGGLAYLVLKLNDMRRLKLDDMRRASLPGPLVSGFTEVWRESALKRIYNRLRGRSATTIFQRI